MKRIILLILIIAMLPMSAMAQSGHGLQVTSCYSDTGRCIPQTPDQPAAIGSTLVIELDDADDNTLEFAITGNPTLTGQLPYGIHRKYCVNADGVRSHDHLFVVSREWTTPLITECAVPPDVRKSGQTGKVLFVPLVQNGL